MGKALIDVFRPPREDDYACWVSICDTRHMLSGTIIIFVSPPVSGKLTCGDGMDSKRARHANSAEKQAHLKVHYWNYKYDYVFLRFWPQGNA